jgi:hypothetical protein
MTASGQPSFLPKTPRFHARTEMGKQVIDSEKTQDAASIYTKKRSIPAEIRELLADLAEIRQTVLVGSPALLPRLAPAPEHAEMRIQQMY